MKRQWKIQRGDKEYILTEIDNSLRCSMCGTNERVRVVNFVGSDSMSIEKIPMCFFCEEKNDEQIRENDKLWVSFYIAIATVVIFLLLAL